MVFLGSWLIEEGSATWRDVSSIHITGGSSSLRFLSAWSSWFFSRVQRRVRKGPFLQLQKVFRSLNLSPTAWEGSDSFKWFIHMVQHRSIFSTDCPSCWARRVSWAQWNWVQHGLEQRPLPFRAHCLELCSWFLCMNSCNVFLHHLFEFLTGALESRGDAFFKATVDEQL